MKKIKITSNAKINFTLDLLGLQNGYHLINSLVASLDLADTVIVKTRNDKKITVKVKGAKLDCEEKDNNAYKSAKLFMQTFNTNGVEIIIRKKIPVGGGLGGSSADVVGVIKAMAKLYGIDQNLVPVLKALGSDTVYMYKGGYALMQGRGELVTRLNINKKLYFILMKADGLISSKFAFSLADKMQVEQAKTTLRARRCLENDDFDGFKAELNNHLYLSSKEISKEVQTNFEILSKYGKANMTGSGNVTYLTFQSEKERNAVYKALSKEYKQKLVKAQTV